MKAFLALQSGQAQTVPEMQGFVLTENLTR